ncbi:PO113 protein, partial [Larus smithsonianus]|nr:PO113 protein [Larus smithsonianus]
LGEGNARADAAVSCVVHVPPQNKFERARNSHETFHQNARALHRQFQIPLSDAQGIVRACPQCSHHGPGIGLGTNPKGLKALELWQMDVTHVPEFGRLKYVHVTVDTYSKFIWATAQ